MLKPLNLGDVTVTKNLLEAGVTREELNKLLDLHAQGDWGALDKRDKAMQDILCAPDNGPDTNEMLMSVWTVTTGDTVWIVTHVGYATTVMLREDN